MGAHVGVNLAGDGAAVEILHAMLGNTPQRAAHVGVAQQLADLAHAAVGPQVDLGGRGAIAQHPGALDAAALRRLHPEAVHMRADRKAVFGVGNGRRQQIGQAAGAEAA